MTWCRVGMHDFRTPKQITSQLLFRLCLMKGPLDILTYHFSRRCSIRGSQSMRSRQRALPPRPSTQPKHRLPFAMTEWHSNVLVCASIPSHLFGSTPEYGDGSKRWQKCGPRQHGRSEWGAPWFRRKCEWACKWVDIVVIWERTGWESCEEHSCVAGSVVVGGRMDLANTASEGFRDRRRWASRLGHEHRSSAALCLFGRPWRSCIAARNR